MERLLKVLEQFFDRLLTRETLTEVAAAFAAFGIAWLLGRLIRGWHTRREPGVALSLRDRAGLSCPLLGQIKEQVKAARGIKQRGEVAWTR